MSGIDAWISFSRRASGLNVYRALAVEQRELATNALLADIRTKHLELSALWVRLAEEAERRAQAADGDQRDPTVREGPAANA